MLHPLEVLSCGLQPLSLHYTDQDNFPLPQRSLQLKDQPRDERDTAWQGNHGGWKNVIALERWAENWLKESGVEEKG